MASYSYCNGVYQVTTFVRSGFKRFHSMNAQYRIQKCAGENITRYYFVSYATPIMYAFHIEDTDKWFIHFNDNPFGFSSSTSRQLSKFLNEFSIPATPWDIKNTIKKAHFFGTPDSNTAYLNDNVESNVVISLCSDRLIREYFDYRF